MATITTILNLLTKIREDDIVKVKFTKVDGTTRIMRCTLNFNRIPVRDRPKDVNIPKIIKLAREKKVIHVYDVEKTAWRSIPFDRFEFLETSDHIVYRVDLKE